MWIRVKYEFMWCAAEKKQHQHPAFQAVHLLTSPKKAEKLCFTGDIFKEKTFSEGDKKCHDKKWTSSADTAKFHPCRSIEMATQAQLPIKITQNVWVYLQTL